MCWIFSFYHERERKKIVQVANVLDTLKCFLPKLRFQQGLHNVETIVKELWFRNVNNIYSKNTHSRSTSLQN